LTDDDVKEVRNRLLNASVEMLDLENEMSDEVWEIDKRVL
jgi:hypothetical protein